MHNWNVAFWSRHRRTGAAWLFVVWAAWCALCLCTYWLGLVPAVFAGTVSFPLLATVWFLDRDSKTSRTARRRGRFIKDELDRLGVGKQVYSLVHGERDIGFYDRATDLTIWEGPVYKAIGVLAELPDAAGYHTFLASFGRAPALALVA